MFPLQRLSPQKKKGEGGYQGLCKWHEAWERKGTATGHFGFILELRQPKAASCFQSKI